MIKPDDPRIIRIPVQELTHPGNRSTREAYTFFCNHWWVIDKGELLFWWIGREQTPVPQCNVYEAVAEGLRRKLYPWALITKIPQVHVRERWYA